MKPCAALLVLLACAGCGGKEPKPLGGLLTCRGEGRTVAVFEAGLGVLPATAWSAVTAKLDDRMRVCLHERQGNRTAGAAAEQLHAHLERAGIDKAIFVGASFGGFVTQLEASRHPQGVAGMVLVDSLHPDLDREIEPLLGKRGARERRQALAQNAEGVSYGDLLASDDELRRASGDFPPVPLIALKHGISFDPGGEPVPSIERLWGRLQEANAKLSPTGRVVVAERSHHRIAEDQPELVVDAIREVVEAARAGG